MNTGDLRYSVQIEQKTITGQDSYGQDIYTWTVVATLWCEVRAMTGRELEAAQQLHAEARWKMQTHYPSVTIKREMRAVFGSPPRVLDILDAEDPTGKRREMVLLLKGWTE